MTKSKAHMKFGVKKPIKILNSMPLVTGTSFGIPVCFW
jgi:hypothetical protein